MAPRLAVCAVVLGLTCACSQGPAATGSAPASSSASAGQTRTYYIAADDVVWDFAPSGKQPDRRASRSTSEASFFAKPGPSPLGHVYRKSLFREYTDATFTHAQAAPRGVGAPGHARPAHPRRGRRHDPRRLQEQRAVPASLHPHGVFYAKDSEGAPYNDGTGAAPTSTTTRCRLARRTPTCGRCPSARGPRTATAARCSGCITRTSTRRSDVNSGLIGPLIVTAKGQAQAGRFAQGRRSRVRRRLPRGRREPELATSTTTSRRTRAIQASRSKTEQLVDPLDVANLKETINGFVYGNTPGFTMQKGQNACAGTSWLDELRVPLAALARQHRRRAPHAARTWSRCSRWTWSSPTWCRTTSARGCFTATPARICGRG